MIKLLAYFLIFLGITAFIFGAFAFSALVIMLLWNYVLHAIWHDTFPVINFWYALGISLILTVVGSVFNSTK